MAAAKPWMKFYPRDWRADEKLRDCSLAARGLWIEMLAIMHASERYGMLLIAGTAPSARRIANQVGGSEAEVEALLTELKTAQVFSRDAQGIIYSRRMKTDEKTAEKARKVGKLGGNPKLLKHTENSAQDKGGDIRPDKLGDKPRGQRPENREERTPKPPSLPDDVKAVLEAGGFASPPGDLGFIRQWYGAGADLNDLVTVIGREAEKIMQRGHGAPRTLKIFDVAIRDKLAADAREIEHLRKVARRNSPAEQPGVGG